MSTTYILPSVPRQDINLDSSWRFHKGDVSDAQAVSFNDIYWKGVSVPYTWNALDGQNGGNDYWRGIGWYRRHVSLPVGDTGRELFLKFDGADITADVYLNGTLVGSHAGGVTAFTFDVTPYVHIGADNVVAVKVSNAKGLDVTPLTSDYTLDGGIYRDVHLLVLDKLHVDPTNSGSPGVFLQTSNVSALSATLQVTTDIRNDNSTASSVTVKTFVVNAATQTMQTLTTTKSVSPHSSLVFSSTAVISNPHLWDGRLDPYLYTAYVQVGDVTGVKDLVSQPLGFRWYTATANNGFFLDGKPYDLHGVAFQEDRLNKGWSITPADAAQDVSLINEIGATAVRLTHYPQSLTTFDLLDHYGIIAWSEIPLLNRINGDQAFADNAKAQLRELILQNFNHPAVCFWGIFNEITGTAGPDPNTLINQLNTLAHSLDPTRPTTAASSSLVADPVNKHTDLLGYNRYYGWYYGTLADVPTALDTLHQSLPGVPLAISEYGAGASINQHTDSTAKPVAASRFHPEEYQARFHEAYWAALAARPYIWGKFVFDMFDFIADIRDEGDAPGRNDKGLVTLDRTVKKDAFYFYKANWSSDPVLYITDRRFTQRTSATTDVKIYSNCDSVTLSINGKTIGTMKSTNHIFTWAGVNLSPGDNTIRVSGQRGGATFTDVCVWTLVAPVATVRGVVFKDNNSNGVLDAKEPSLAGWRIYVDTNSDSTWQSSEASAITDSTGSYTLAGLAPGSYVIRVVRPAGWAQTYPALNYGQHITLAAGQTKTAANFGVKN